MPLPEQNISSNLVDLLKDRFEISDSVDEQGQLTDDPEDMKVFSFNYITQSGKDKGSVVISLLDDSESSGSMKIYFGQDLADADSDTRTEWYKFLQQLRQFAKMHLLGFDVRNINKSQISRRDVEKDLKLVKEDLEPMFEGSFEPIDGTVKTSHQKLAGKPIKIVIKHTTKVDPSVKGSRSRRINKIYLVNADNERFLLPFRNLIAARAMARHIENGGTPYDNVGRDICQLVEEMVSLNKFYNKQKNNQFSNPNAANAISSARERYLEIKKTLASLSTKGGYAKNSPSLTGNAGELEDDDEMMEDVFDGSTMDEESQLALPHVMRAYRNHPKTEEEGEFEKWVNAANGQGEGQEILADEEEPYAASDFVNSSVREQEPTGDNEDEKETTQFISMSGSTESKKNAGKIVESIAQKERGKKAANRDIQLLRKQKAESEENFPFEYGGMNGSIPTSDEISAVGGQMTFESGPYSENNPDRAEWTACETYGHDYETDENDPNLRRCIDCGDEYSVAASMPIDPIVAREREKLAGEEDYNWTPELEEGFAQKTGQAIVNAAKKLKNVFWPDDFDPAMLDKLSNLDQNHFTVAQVAEAIKVPMFMAQQICNNGVKDGSFIDHIGVRGSYYSTKQAVPEPNYFNSEKWGRENRPNMHESIEKPKCPHCGSNKYSLMPTDFETAKCKDCGKNWNHGIVKGINDPYENSVTESEESEADDAWKHDWRAGHEKEQCPCCHGEGCRFCDKEFDLDDHMKFDKESIDESLLREFFGFNKEAKTRTESLTIEKLLKDLDFELVNKTENSQIWRKSYFTIIFGPAENGKLGWAINRNGQFKARGFGSRNFFEEFFMNNPEFREELRRLHSRNNEKEVNESVLTEFFGFGKKDPEKSREECKKEFESMMELLKFLGFERINVFDDINTVWKNRYYTIMVIPHWSQKGKFEINWSITRNKKKVAVGVGLVAFGKEILSHDEFRDYKNDFLKIVANSQKSPVTEADVPSSAAWGSPLTFVSADLPNHYRTSKEIAHHKNTTGKLSPFSLLNRQESDKDANGKDLNRVTDMAGNGRPIQSANAGGFTGKKGNERPSNL